MTNGELDVLVERALGSAQASGKNAFSTCAGYIAAKTGKGLSESAEWLAKMRPSFYEKYR